MANLQSVVAEATRLKEKYADEPLARYHRAKRAPAAAHALSAVVTVILGLAIPMVALGLQQDPNGTIAVSVCGFTVAAVTSLNAFFRWDWIWRRRYRAEQALARVVARWEVEMLRAATKPVDGTAVEVLVVQATQRLIDDATEVVGEEVEGHMASIKTAGDLGRPESPAAPGHRRYRAQQAPALAAERGADADQGEAPRQGARAGNDRRWQPWQEERAPSADARLARPPAARSAR
jgi:hypothetical protein